MMMPRLMLLNKLILLGIWQCCFADDHGMEMLEPFIGHEAGIALKADNDEYIGRKHQKTKLHPFKTHNTRFQVFKSIIPVSVANTGAYNMYSWTPYITTNVAIATGKVVLIGDDGRPLCLVETEHSGYDKLWVLFTLPIEQLLETTTRKWCEFTPVAHVSYITFKGHNGKYLKRFNVDEHDWIIADSSSPFDPYANFLLESGSITQISETIVSIEWGDPPTDASDASSDLVMATKFVNNCMQTDVEKTVSITKSFTTTETTSWENSWSFSIGASYTHNFVAVSLSVSAELSYGRNDGAENEITHTSTMEDSSTMIVPPRTQMIFELKAKTFNDVSIPFIATIERTFDGKKETIKQPGTWQAEIYYASDAKVYQVDMSDDECMWGGTYMGSC